MTKILVLAAIAAMTLTAAPAFAEQAPAQVLRTSDVNFHDRVATEAFYNKLARTAAAVCNSNSANPIVTQDDRVCAKATLEDAVSRMGQPLLTAVHDNAQEKGVNLASR